jgi:hypothetical protein
MPRSARTSPNDLVNPSTKIAGPELVCDTYPPVRTASHICGTAPRTYRPPCHTATEKPSGLSHPQTLPTASDVL